MVAILRLVPQICMKTNMTDVLRISKGAILSIGEKVSVLGFRKLRIKISS